LGGYLAPMLLAALLVVPGAIVSGTAAQVLRRAVALALPFGIAVGLVSIFTRPGATVLFAMGPFDATLEGVDFAAKVVVRLVVMAAALVLFGLTTTTRDLVVDLERRGVPARLCFALGAVTGTVPALAQRAMEVRDAQRARALDTEGGLWRRSRGILPLVGPVVVGSLHEVEARSLALEARGFGRPGRRHLLWAPEDSHAEPALRWLLLVALGVVIAGSVAGVLPRLP
jgi:energy-coupling factor transport system permease protein